MCAQVSAWLLVTRKPVPTPVPQVARMWLIAELRDVVIAAISTHSLGCGRLGQVEQRSLSLMFSPDLPDLQGNSHREISQAKQHNYTNLTLLDCFRSVCRQ